MTKIEQIRKTVDAIRAKEMTTPDEVFGRIAAHLGS